MKNLLFIFFAFINVSYFLNAEVITNQPLFENINRWKYHLEHGDTYGVLAEIETSMSADIVPWRMPVIKGKDWAYSWGFFAYKLKACALQKNDKFAEAYRALMDGYAYLPKKVPSKNFSNDYWKWWLVAGELTGRMGRHLDAEWYLTKVRNAFTTNDTLYLKATAALAGFLRYEGRIKKSKLLYDKLFRLKPKQPTKVWHNYIRLLFDLGNFEEGVRAILCGAKANGISSLELECDYFIEDTCSHWHLFDKYDIIEWYEFLGEQLDTVRLEKGKEKLIALLINIRSVIKKTYPELFFLSENDLMALKRRLESEKTNQVSGVSGRQGQVSIKKENTIETKRKKVSQRVFKFQFNEQSDTNLLIEDLINVALLKTQVMWRKEVGRTNFWGAILDKFTTNQLSKVIIDGESALFHIYAALGAICVGENMTKEGKKWLLKTLQLPETGGNTYRYVDVLLHFGNIYFRYTFRDIEEAKYYFNWAKDLVGKNERQKVRIKSGLGGVALFEAGPESRIKYLQEILDNYGCIPRRNVYERLARDYYRIGNFRKGFETYIEGIKRTELKMTGSRFDHMVDGLFMNKSFHTSEELKKLQNIIQTSTLRYPATLKYTPTISKLFALAELPWFKEHIKLAKIEEQSNFSNESWLYISNTVFKSPSIRAGLLYTKAQLARDFSVTNKIDWRGWLKGWETISSEIKSQKPGARVQTGNASFIHQFFIDQLKENVSRIDDKSLEKSCFVICDSMKKVRNKQFDNIVEIYEKLNKTNLVFKLHFTHISTIRRPSTKNPSFKAMVEMYSKLEKNQKVMLEKLLCNKYKYEKNEESKGKWIEFMKQCGIDNPSNTL